MVEYYPEQNNPAQKTIQVEGYKQRIAHNGSNQPEYIGLAKPGTATSESKWQIRKLTYSGNVVTQIDFANGSLAFANVWDDRESLSYS